MISNTDKEMLIRLAKLLREAPEKANKEAIRVHATSSDASRLAYECGMLIGISRAAADALEEILNTGK